MTNTVFKKKLCTKQVVYYFKNWNKQLLAQCFKNTQDNKKAVLTGVPGFILQPFLNLKKGVWAVKYNQFPVSEPSVSVNNEAEPVVSSQFLK